MNSAKEAETVEQERNIQATKLAVEHYWQQIRHDWCLALPAFLLPALGTIMVFYVPPLIIAKVLVRFGHQSSPNFDQLIPYILAFALVWSLGEMLWRLAIHFLIKAESRGSARLYNQAMDLLFEKDITFFYDNFAGSLTKRVMGYGRKYIDLMDTLSFSVFSEYLPVIFVAIVLWTYSPWLVVGLLSLMYITVFIVAPLIKHRQKLVAAREAASNVVAAHVADTLANMETVKAFSQEGLEAKTHQSLVRDFMAKSKKSWDYQNLNVEITISPFYVLTNTVGLALALIVSHHGAGSLAAVFVTFSYYTGVTRNMWNFNSVYRNIEFAVTEAAQFTELLLEPPILSDSLESKLFVVKSGEVKFQNVSFRYSDSSGEHLFKNFNLHINSGEKVALVGYSGSGKTTVTRLLLRFMDVSNGQILIDGQNIAEVTQNDLRSNIAYVPQEPAMFHRSLSDNIRYGKLNAPNKDVEKVAKLSHAAEFIENLPKRYETLVGERGVKLSGGQRQRIAIARAMLKNAPILVLDEATSALDSESELLIQKALWKLMEKRTTIVIAHRLSTIQRMDRIVVLDEGQIIEQGTHKELLSAGGTYAKLWAHQSGGFLNE